MEESEKKTLYARLVPIFLEEADELVGKLNDLLIVMEREGPEPRRIDEALRAAHSLKGAARSIGSHEIERRCHDLEETLAKVRDKKVAPDRDVLSPLFCLLDDISSRASALRGEDPKKAKRAGPAEESLPTAPTRVFAFSLESLLASAGELAVSLSRLKTSVSALTELCTRQATSATPATTAEMTKIATALETETRALDGLARTIRLDASKLRMLPFAESCQGLSRLVRDIARAAGKEAELTLAGGEILADRLILEGIKDPLRHLVRNAVYHGIETPAARRALGKPVLGNITVSAELQGERLVVYVADDGSGLDASALREAALSRGVFEKDLDPAKLVFMPGLTTVAQVGEVSGRGVGLDAVKSRIEALHGLITVQWEEKKFTRFTMTLPVRLSSVRALFVKAANRIFAIPSGAVERLARIKPGETRSLAGKPVLVVPGGEPLLLVRLSHLLRLPETNRQGGEAASTIILGTGSGRIAISVDELLHEAEIVIRPLGPRVKGTPPASGVTALPSGALALVLSAPRLVEAALGNRWDLSRSAAAEGPAPPKKKFRPKQVLVAEDSVTTRALMKSILESHGYAVTVAPDGEAAWRLLEENGADVLVTDIEMPRLGGFDLARRVRSSTRFAALPIVILTTRGSDEDKRLGIEVGANAYLVKSAFDQGRLLETIEELC